MVRYRVQLFAILREKVGVDTWEIQVEEPLTAVGLLAAFFLANPNVSTLHPVTRLAVNQVFAEADGPLKESDELALIPPVSGG